MSEPRVDLRLPSDLYEKIEKIAHATNQPFTPKSKNTDNPKPVLTQVIIKLIQLGLSQIDETELESLENDNKELTLKPSANQIEVEEIEKKILNTLLQKLEAIVSDKLEDMVTNKINEVISTRLNQNQSDLETMVTSKINEVISTIKDNQEDKPEIVESNETDFNLEIKEIFSLEELEDNEIVNHTESQIKLNFDIDNNQLEINQETDNSSLTFEDTVNEINKLNSLGLNYAQIAKKLEGIYPTKQGKFNWKGNQVQRILEKI